LKKIVTPFLCKRQKKKSGALCKTNSADRGLAVFAHVVAAWRMRGADVVDVATATLPWVPAGRSPEFGEIARQAMGDGK